MKQNNTVRLNDNEVSSAGSHATGGAIAMHGTSQVVQLDSNCTVELKGNKAISTWSNPDQSGDYVTAGGAIYAPTATVSLCGTNGNINGTFTESNTVPTVTISNNVAEMTNGNVRGGAIDAGNLDISSNKNVVEISGNHASSTNTTEAYSALGGALSTTLSGGIHKISRNGNQYWNALAGGVSISNNYASSSSTQGTARGGFFYGAEGTTLEISGNYCDVTISGNHVNSASTADDAALGGAIYGSSLVIKDNESAVQLFGNYEKTGESCRLRAVYLDSASADARLELSAGTGYSIKFEDAVYANVSNITINASSNGITNGGSVIFSGGNVERYLSEYAGVDTPSAEDVTASRTSYFGSVINVHGGTLEARNAILQGKGLEAASGSGATVLLTHAAMQHSESTVQFNSGTTLAAQGVSTLAAGKLQMENLSSMQFILGTANATTAALTYTGELSLAGDLQLNVRLDSIGSSYTGGTLKLLTLEDTAKKSWDNGSRKLTSFQMAANSKLMGDLEWQGNTLVYTCWSVEDGKKITWGNNSQDGRWDNLSKNWSYDGKAASHTGVNAIYFDDSGSGTVTLCGALTPGDVYVQNSAGKDYTWKADSTLGGKLSGTHGLNKSGAGSLTIEADLDYTGATAVSGGILTLKGTSTLKGEFTNDATIAMEGNTTMSGQLTNNGTVKVEGAAKLTKVNSINGKIIITDSGKLNLTTSQTITSKGDGQGTATVKGSTGAGNYSISNAKYEISNARVTATGSTTIKNKLTNTTVVNNSNSLLKVDNADNTLSGVQALKHNVQVLSRATHVLDELVINDNRMAEFYIGSVVSTTQEASISVSRRAEFGKNTTLKANFTLESTAELFMADTVTLGSELVFEAGAELSGAVYDNVLTLSDIGTSVVLFDSVDKLTLTNGSTSTSYLAGELTAESQVLASTYFANLSSRKDLYITFDSAAGGQVCITMGEVIPEPASATLGLAALMMLCARRRRKA